MTSGENPAYPPTDQACYLIGGSLGTLELPCLRLWQHQGRRSWWEPIAATTPPRASGDSLVLQINHFADVIGGKCPPLVSGREGMRSLAVIEAILASAAQGVRVELT